MPIPPIIAQDGDISSGGGGLPGSGGVARSQPGSVGSLSDPPRKPFPDAFDDDDASPASSPTRTES